MKNELSKIYYDAKNPGSFGGVDRLYQAAKKLGYTLSQVRDWLDSQSLYVTHKPAKRKFARQKTRPIGVNTQYHIDLIDFVRIKTHNRYYAYILIAVDCTSRKVYAAPMKHKRPTDALEALKSLQLPSTPWFLYADMGKEWGGQFRAYCKDKIINLVMSQNPETKAYLAEAAIKQVKNKLGRIMTHRGNKKWIDVIHDVVESINNSVQRGIGVSPNDVNQSNEAAIIERMRDKRKPKYRYKVGQRVRVSQTRNIFSKGYSPVFGPGQYTIIKRAKGRYPAQYKLADQLGDAVEGLFYEQELAKNE